MFCDGYKAEAATGEDLAEVGWSVEVDSRSRYETVGGGM